MDMFTGVTYLVFSLGTSIFFLVKSLNVWWNWDSSETTAIRTLLRILFISIAAVLSTLFFGSVMLGVTATVLTFTFFIWLAIKLLAISIRNRQKRKRFQVPDNQRLVFRRPTFSKRKVKKEKKKKRFAL